MKDAPCNPSSHPISMLYQQAVTPLFDVSGRRITPQTLDAAVNPASSRYALAQPVVDYSVIYSRISEHFPAVAGVSGDEFEQRARALRDELRHSEATAELANGVH